MRKKYPLCPIGLVCPENPCSNFHYCKNQTSSWGLPYKYDSINRILTVQFDPYRYSWSEKAKGLREFEFCNLPNGDYLQIDLSYDDTMMFKMNLIEIWKQAGWAEAKPIR